MARLLTASVVKLPPDEARKYFSDSHADLSARWKLLDLAERVYVGPGDTESNIAVASLMHAVDYLADRIAYEMNPHPKGMVKL